jgi:CheY-like chemotaxis protein/HPt (histidine-containing phosphotransfer) domain-containing protein
MTFKTHMEVPVPIKGFSAIPADALLHSLSCELRQPVQALPQLLGQLAESSLGSKQRAALEAAAQHAGRIQSLVADAEAWAALSIGAPHRWKATFSVRDLIDETLETFEDRAQRQRTEIRSRPPAPATDLVRAEESLLAVVLQKILGHCLDHTREGQVVVQARCQTAPDEVGQLHFEIRDTGAGIAPEDLAGYFEPGRAGHDHRRGDAGFGLALAKALVEAMGGELTVQAGPLGGAIFKLQLPVECRPGSDPDTSGTVLNCFHAYLVQDRLKTSNLLQSKILDWCGTCITVDESTLWQELDMLNKTSARQTSLVLLDLKTMPDNLDLAKRIMSRKLHVPLRLVALADVTLPPTDEALMVNGVDGVLIRPFRVAEMRRSLEAVFNGERPVASPPSPGPETLSASTPAAAPSRRVLLVDDNPINRKVGTKQLERLGFEVQTANNGQEAVDAVLREPWDVVLMDCMMPVMDGFEATRRIRAHESARARTAEARYTVIVALTANVSDKHRELCFESGMDEFLGKPVLAEELKATIDRLIEAPPRPPESAPVPTDSSEPVAAAAAEPAGPPEGFDLARLNEMTDGDQSIIEELVKMYLDQTDGQFAELAEAAQRGSAVDVRRLAHSACGASNSIGVVGFVPQLREIEHRADAGNLDGVVALVDEVRRIYGGLAVWMRRTLLPAAVAAPVPAEAPLPEGAPINPAFIDALRINEGAEFAPLFTELVRSFGEETSRRARELQDALGARTPDRILPTVRALRTAGANLGAERLAAACKTIENLPPGADWTEVEQRVQRVNQEIRMASEHLSRELAQTMGA